jgi:hypothetical protein
MAEQQMDRRPRANTVVDKPATPDVCRRDYDAAEDVRATSVKQQARTDRRR